MNLLKNKFPEIFQEIDLEKNNFTQADADLLTFGSKKKIWWKCSKNHSWLSSIKNRSNCPYCTNKKVLPGFNDLKTLFPDIAKEYSKKNKIPIEQLMPNSHKKVYWNCPNGHTYASVIESRTVKKTGCAYCSGRLPIKGKTDFASNFPELLKEWDYELNIIKPDEITTGSGKKVYWKCSKNHSWFASVYSRTSKTKTNCPYCSSRKVLQGENDLLTVFPDLCKEGNPTGWWDYEKNLNEFNLKPDEIMAYSNKKFWWICQKNHSYLAIVYNRTYRNSGCPYCANKKVLPGFNDLQTRFPEVAKEYSDKNELPANQIIPGNHNKMWWNCPNGHSYSASPVNRTFGRSGCPHCINHQTSKREQLIFEELNKFYICEKRKKHKINGKSYETDIFIPELNLGIEFNGIYWHKIKEDKTEKDKLKESVLSSKMKLLYVLEDTENKIIGNKIYFNYKKRYETNFVWALEQLKRRIDDVKIAKS